MPDVEDGGSNTAIQEQQFNALGTIEIISFTANPPAVAPFESTTLSWKVKLPQTLHVLVQFVVAGKTFSGTSGSVTTEVAGTTEFGLTAKTNLVSRMIGAVTVTSDTSACVTTTYDATTVADVVTGEVNAAIPSGNQFSFRGDGPSSTLGDGTITVDIPLNIDVPDWFDAQADVTIVLNVGASGPVAAVKAFVSLASVNVDVSWGLASQILSLGCEHFIETAMQKVAEAFLTEIVSTQVAPQTADSLNKLVQTTADMAKGNDPQHRKFALTSLTVSSDGLNYTVCPQPNPPAGPPGRLPLEPVHGVSTPTS